VKGGEKVDYLAKVKDIVADQLGINREEIKPESSFIDDLDADSLDIVELVMALEEEYDLEIPDAEAEKIVTVGDAVEYLRANLWYIWHSSVAKTTGLSSIIQNYSTAYSLPAVLRIDSGWKIWKGKW